MNNEHRVEGRALFVSEMSGQVYTKAVTQGRPDNPVVSILTYPTQDYAGDIVRPDGGDWSQYPTNPYVNWSHRCPIGRGIVNHRILKFEGKVCPVAVGETAFFQKKADIGDFDLRRRDPRTHQSWDKEKPYTTDEVLEASAQAERLIRDDIANGVSIEFDVDQKRKGQDWWDLGKQSLLENRPARHFEVWRGLGYAHARQPVNPGCLTLSGQPRLTPKTEAIEKAIRVAQTGKLPGGEPVCEIIIKSFQDLKHYKGATMVTVKGDVPTGNDHDNVSGGVNADTKMGAGHRALMNFVQGLYDLCVRVEEEGAESDDLGIRKFVRKVCAKGKDLAGDVKARAEKHRAKLDGTDKDDEDVMDEDDYEPSKEEKAIEVDDKGNVITKSFPDWKPVRMSFANLVETKDIVHKAESQDTVSPEEERAAMRRLRRAMKKVQPLIDAAVANGIV